jgi:uncharacterized protein YuzE
MLVNQRLPRIMKHQTRIEVKSSKPPTVEFDTSVWAWYVRFSTKPVVKTLPVDAQNAVVTVDLDEAGEVVGVELLGVRAFEIGMVQKLAHVDAPNVDMSRVRFLPAMQALHEEAA